MGPHQADLAQKLHILLARSFFPGQDKIVGLGLEHFERGSVIGCASDFPGRQHLRHRRGDFGVRADYQSCFSRA